MEKIKIDVIYSKTNADEVKSTLEGVDIKSTIEWLVCKLKSTFGIEDSKGFKLSMKTMMPVNPETGKVLIPKFNTT